MNINIYSNYQSPVFGMAKLPQGQKAALGRIVGALTLAAPIAHEINSDRFVKQNSQGPRSYTEQLTDMINSKPILKNNKNIQANFDSIVMNDMDLPETAFGEMSIRRYVSEKTNARIKVLRYYANNSEIQNNDLIKDKIGKLVSFLKKDEQANVVIEALGTNNLDKEYYDKLGDMLNYNICPDIIKKVMSNQTLYSNIKAVALYTVRGYEQRLVQKMNEMLDSYLDTREKFNNDRNLDTILLKSFSQYKADPLIYSKKMQADYDFDNEIDNALFEIESRNKNDKEILQKSIGDLRALRDDIKEYAGQFDKNLKTGILKPSLKLLNDNIKKYKKLLNGPDKSSVNDDLSEYELIKSML